MAHPTTAELEAGLPTISAAPADRGRVELVVRRPTLDARELLDSAALDPAVGLVGDTWITRASGSSPDGGPHPDKQLTLINSRVSALLGDDPTERAGAGDQLHVDLDLSVGNLPPGTRLRIGTAEVEITAPQHRGCAKFAARFGPDALHFVNTLQGQAMRLRGVNARVVRAGTVRTGDDVVKLT